MMMNLAYAGELAAFGTVLCWTIGAQCFEAAGKRAGSLPVNLIRLIVAFVLFCFTHLIRTGTWLPLDFPAAAWCWLLVSGMIGFSLGDMFLFRAFVEVGPRISMLIMALTAPMTALIGRVFLNEQYGVQQWTGVLVTISGVSWVILKRNNKNAGNTGAKGGLIEREITIKGVLLAFGGAVGQSVGFIFSKRGMMIEGGYLDPFSSTQIRVIGGIIGFFIIFTVFRFWPRVLPAVRNLPAMGFTGAGAFLGPYLGVGLSLLALHYTTAGVASTIMSLVPITLIPFSIFLHKEKVSIHSLLGTVVAIAGVVMLIN